MTEDAILSDVAELARDNVLISWPFHDLEVPCKCGGRQDCEKCEGTGKKPCAFSDHLSANSLATAEECLEKVRRRYVLGETDRTGSALILGGAFHSAMERNLRQKITSQRDMETKHVQEAFASSWEKKIDEAGGQFEVEWKSERPGKVKDRGVAAVTTAHVELAPKLRPIAVEEKFSVEIPGVAVPVIGYIDTETALSISDFKTASRATKKPKPKWLIAGRIYQRAKHKPFEWFVATTAGTPQIITSRSDGASSLRIEADRFKDAATDLYVRRIAAQIAWCMDTFGPYEPWPGAITVGSGYGNGVCDYCAYQRTCAHWQ